MNNFCSTVILHFSTLAAVLAGISGTTKQLNMQCYQHRQHRVIMWLFGGQQWTGMAEQISGQPL
jgi:hypothetical protein